MLTKAAVEAYDGAVRLSAHFDVINHMEYVCVGSD